MIRVRLAPMDFHGDSDEKRSHGRVPARLPMEADLDGRRVQILAVNLSEGGAYCCSQTPFPLMTRLEVSLELPANGAEQKAAPLRMQAVVVRCEPHPTAGANWNLALFFASPEPAARERLERFVRSRRAGGSGSPRCDD